MIFNFLAYIDELRNHADKKKVIEEYEELFGTIQGDIKSQIRFTEYLTNFPFFEYAVPEAHKDEFNRDILQKLIVGSFSSDCILDKVEGQELRDLVVSVKSGEQSVVKKISELRQHQLQRLFEIYTEEEMNLQILMKKEEKEREAIIAQRQARIQRWKLILESLGKDEQAAQAKEEQESKLWDLYSQL